MMTVASANLIQLSFNKCQTSDEDNNSLTKSFDKRLYQTQESGHCRNTHPTEIVRAVAAVKKNVFGKSSACG